MPYKTTCTNLEEHLTELPKQYKRVNDLVKEELDNGDGREFGAGR